MRKKFEESQHRIQSMALLHESLCQSADLARIDFAEYVRKLAGQLFQFYSAGTRIQLHTDLERLYFDMDTAVPCGLIINELVSNSLKYAFPDGRSGLVHLELREVSSGRAHLTVSDDGAGFVDDFDWLSARSLGLRLVRSLGEQLGATVQMERRQGTAFTIEFPVPDASNQEVSGNG